VRRRSASGGAGIGAPFKVELPRSAFYRRPLAGSLPAPAWHAEELVKRLGRFEPFRRIPAEELRTMASAATRRRYRTGEYLWQQGEAAGHAAFLECGFAKLVRQRPDGVAATYALFGPGDCIGLLAICTGMRYLTDAIALNDGLEVVLVDSQTIRRISDKSLELGAAIREELTRFSTAFMTKIDIVSAGSVPQRLAVLMLHLVDRYGAERRGTRARVPFSIPRDELGQIVGAREETVVRALIAWKRCGWLETRADGYHVERLDKLREAAAEPLSGK
jgi:CRP-like cAMP-binding protein